ncbi:hypothetical protein Cgig2_028315 [Carnegiea gigantea]|uniref:Uncharacterized protein n=1 Tax=Carnegiea gigantea TaxID=171969 RepID=A0A9Q1KJ30_9CARY|nr:hypothetical protein Cgig2_028315 [Carnegiea gigantea]
MYSLSSFLPLHLLSSSSDVIHLLLSLQHLLALRRQPTSPFDIFFVSSHRKIFMPSFMSPISYIPSLSPGHSLRSAGHLLRFCVVLLHLQRRLLIVRQPPAVLHLCQLRQVVTSNLGLETIAMVVDSMFVSDGQRAAFSPATGGLIIFMFCCKIAKDMQRALWGTAVLMQ